MHENGALQRSFSVFEYPFVRSFIPNYRVNNVSAIVRKVNLLFYFLNVATCSEFVMLLKHLWSCSQAWSSFPLQTKETFFSWKRSRFPYRFDFLFLWVSHTIRWVVNSAFFGHDYLLECVTFHWTIKRFLKLRSQSIEYWFALSPWITAGCSRLPPLHHFFLSLPSAVILPVFEKFLPCIGDSRN